MSNHQQETIKKYFNLLVQEFIKNHKEINITIFFTDHLESSEHFTTLGLTNWNYHRKINSEGMQHTFEVSFLNDIWKRRGEQWRRTVVHEFTHLYLFSTIGEHEHDDNFYSWMEYFEDWLNKNQNLTPRKDKSQDRVQHVNTERKIEKKGQMLRERTEFVNLINLITKSTNLLMLEQNWQTIQNHALYDSSKKSFEIYGNNKEILDNHYSTLKEFFQLRNEIKSLKNNSGYNGWKWLAVISLVVIIGWLIVERLREKKKPKILEIHG